jgi:quercetin dioxygenase-like cupin family protein
MKMSHFVLRPDQSELALNVVGTQVTVLASNAATQSYGVTLQQGDKETGPSPHSHDWDECFYVLKGGVEFLCDGKADTYSAGTLVDVPRGTAHGFRYGPGGGQMLEVTGHGALAAQMFTAIDAEIPAGPPDIPRMLEVLGRNGVMVAVCRGQCQALNGGAYRASSVP